MDTKEKFVSLCSMIFISKDGFSFPFEDIEYDSDYNDIRESKDYPLLESKMINLLKLINEDNLLINKDIETELWDLI